MGTPEYMAPEQVRGETVSAATDTYALGVVTYTPLTGHTPFEGHDINQVLASQLDKMPPPMRSKRRDVPRDVEDAVMWALAKDPSHRPGSTGADGVADRAGRRRAGDDAGELPRRLMHRDADGVGELAHLAADLVEAEAGRTRESADTH